MRFCRSALLYACIGITACSSSPESSGGVSPWNRPYPSADKHEKIVYTAFDEQPKYLDPVRSYSVEEAVFVDQIYEPVVQYHYLKRPYTLTPLTAVDLPEVRYLDSQGRVLPNNTAEEAVAFSEYLITIRPGIQFQPHPAFARGDNGEYLYHALRPEQIRSIHRLSDFAETSTRELTADDYVYQIKRLADPHLQCPIAGLMAKYIVGFNEYSERLSKLGAADKSPDPVALHREPMSGVETLDRYRYRIRLNGKYPQFKYWLAMHFFAPMPWEAERFYGQPGLDKRNITLNWYPLGTGPFMLAENNPNLRMVLERNPNFHEEYYPREGEAADSANGMLQDEGQRLPLVDKAIYILEKESIPYWNKFLQGYYDASGISSDSFDQAIRVNEESVTLSDEMQQQGIKLATTVETSIFYMGFNMLDSIVGGDSERARLLRQAISIAVDYEEYISIFRNGRGLAAQGPIPPEISGYEPGAAGINPYVYDWDGTAPRRKAVEYAQQLMVKAGYPGGVDKRSGRPLILNFDTVSAGPDSKAQLNWFRKQFRKLNIDLVIRLTDYNRFQDKVQNGTAQIFVWGWDADYPDPENFLFLLYGPHGRVKYGGENTVNYHNPRFDQLFDAMKNLEDSPRRTAIIHEMLEIVRHDAPWAFGFHPKTYALYHQWVKNIKPNLMARNGLKYRNIDPVLREQMRIEWNQPLLWPLGLMLLLVLLLLAPAVMVYRRRLKSKAL
jgi:oligopeptide transport system substrate-binding protein